MDVKWDVCTESLNCNEDRIPLSINGLNYRVSQDTAAITHMLSLLIDALDDHAESIYSLRGDLDKIAENLNDLR